MELDNTYFGLRDYTSDIFEDFKKHLYSLSDDNETINDYVITCENTLYGTFLSKPERFESIVLCYSELKDMLMKYERFDILICINEDNDNIIKKLTYLNKLREAYDDEENLDDVKYPDNEDIMTWMIACSLYNMKLPSKFHILKDKIKKFVTRK